MKRFIPLAIVFLITSVVSSAYGWIEFRAPYSKTGCVEATDGLFKKLSASLPNNWQVDKKYSCIIVSRKEVIYFYGSGALVSLGALDETSSAIEASKRPEAFIITVEINDLLQQSEYQSIKENNKNIISKVEDFKNRMRHFQGKGDFRPTTEKDKKLFEEYKNNLKGLRYQPLPVGYNKTNTFYVTVNSPPWYIFYDKDVEEECKKILNNILSNFNLYEHSDQRNLLIEAILKSKREQDNYIWNKKKIIGIINF